MDHKYDLLQRDARAIRQIYEVQNDEVSRKLARVDQELASQEEKARKLKSEKEREVNDWNNRIRKTKKEAEVIEEEVIAQKESMGVVSFKLFENKYKVEKQLESFALRQRQAEHVYRLIYTEVHNLKAEMLGKPRVVDKDILYDPVKEH